MRMRQALLNAVTFTLVVCAASGTLYEVFEPCCHEGINWASASYSCDNYPGPVVNISDIDQAACLSIIEVCCMKQTQLNTCEDGKKTALESMLCAIRDTDPGAEQFRECCHCCRLGMEAKRTEPACESPGLGEPCDSKFQECCRGESTEAGNFTGGGGIVKRHSGSDTTTQLLRSTSTSTSTVTTTPRVESTIQQTSTQSSTSNSTHENGNGVGNVTKGDSNDEEDVDECSLFPGQLCSHICINTPSSFLCACPVGFSLDTGFNRTCIPDEEERGTDVEGFGDGSVSDESRGDGTDTQEEGDRNTNRTQTCARDGRCQHICANLFHGGIECRCRSGYRLQSDGRSCQDIDECQERVARCSSNQVCVNTEGSFSCETLARLCRHDEVYDRRTGQCKKDERFTCGQGEVYDPRTRRCKKDERYSCRQGEVYDRRTGQCKTDERYTCGQGEVYDPRTRRCKKDERRTCRQGEVFDPRTGRCKKDERRTCRQGEVYDPRTGRCKKEERYSCRPGFEFSRYSLRCEDINECGKNTDNCKVGERCENTIGSFVCRRIRHCGTGYTLDEASQTCFDTNECRLETHNCRGEFQCQNTEGSFRCVPKVCDAGFRFDTVEGKCIKVNCDTGMTPDVHGRCQDINECVDYGSTACRSHQRCVNTHGSFYCKDTITCRTGYKVGEDGICHDIDECLLGTYKCGPGQECINQQGSYICQCKQRGMVYDEVKGCIDRDECSYGPDICPSGSKCVNTVGSFTCECFDGLMIDDNRVCTDIDECAREGVCQQGCANVQGTFFCTCNRGYQLRDDKRSCEDIDECTQFAGRRRGWNGVCGGNCVNLPGSYRCECPDGWRLKPNKKSCEDIDECKENIAYCPQSDSMCINTRGGYKCPIIQCPDGFLRTNSTTQRNSVRCKRVSVDCEECRKGLVFRSYNFLTFQPRVRIPSALFSMTGSRLVDKFYTWELDIVSARPLRRGVLPVQRSHFSLDKTTTFVRVTLVQQIEGPQDVLLRVTMNTTSYYKGFESKSESHIYLYVTEDGIH